MLWRVSCINLILISDGCLSLGNVYWIALVSKLVNSRTNRSQSPRILNISTLSSFEPSFSSAVPEVIVTGKGSIISNVSSIPLAAAANCCSSIVSISSASRGKVINSGVTILLSWRARNNKSSTNRPKRRVNRSIVWSCWRCWGGRGSSPSATWTLVWIIAIGLRSSWEASAVNCLSCW